MPELLQSPMMDALGRALVHFVWQGAAIALVAWLLMRVPGVDARFRYGAGAIALVAMLAAPLATWAVLAGSSSAAAPPAALSNGALSANDGTAAAVAASVGDVAGSVPAASVMPAAPAFVAIWFIGVAVCSVRLAGGWWIARGMARGSAVPARLEVEVLVRGLAERLQVRRVVRVLESTAVAVPVVVGWLKPVIVLPVAAVAQLSPAQVEALLAHELAHVRRHDYLVNLLQSAAEVLLFYHPAVWWLSRRVRIERELCCDDVTVAVCDRVAYASALGAVAAMMRPQVALAATDGPLARRVRRILGGRDATPAGSAWLPVVLLVAGAIVAAPMATGSLEPDETRHVASTVTATGSVDAQADARLVLEADKVVLDGYAFTADNGRVRMEGPQTTQQQANEARQRAAEADRARAQAQQTAEERRRAELAKVQAEMERAIQMLRERRADTDVQASAELKARLEAMTRDLEELRKRVQAGTATQAQLAAAQVELARAQAQMHALQLQHVETQAIQSVERVRVQSELERLRREFERSRVLVDQGLISKEALQDLEMRIAETSQRLHAAEIARTDLDRANDIAQVRERAVREAAEARHLTDSRALHELLLARHVESVGALEYALSAGQLQTLDTPTQVVAAGDLLRIRVTGEPDLPTVYRIREDGTIKIPLLAPVRVTGQTLAQVREALARQLAGRPGSPKAEVVVLRPRQDRR